MKRTILSIAAATTILIAGGAGGFAAELPTYVSAGLPISPVQVRLLGATNVSEQSPAATSTASAHQLSVLTPRTKLRAAMAAASRTTGRSTQ
jgi:hypothetical protein